MSTNNQILISEIIKRDSSENPQYKNEDSFFEFFAAQQVLKKYDLSDEEIEQHLTGSGNDGGCDGVFSLQTANLSMKMMTIPNLSKTLNSHFA